MQAITTHIISGEHHAKQSLSTLLELYQRIQDQIDSLRHSFQSEHQEKIVIPTMEGLHVIRLDSIVHIIGSANYSTFHLENGEKIMASKHLKYYENLLPGEHFFRSHQSHLINIRFIKKISISEGCIIELEEGSSIPLARRRKEDLLTRLQGIR